MGGGKRLLSHGVPKDNYMAQSRAVIIERWYICCCRPRKLSKWHFTGSNSFTTPANGKQMGLLRHRLKGEPGLNGVSEASSGYRTS